MFLQSLVERASDYTKARNAKTMTTSHLKRCITSENQFDFLKDLVANVPDLPSNEEEKDGEPKPKRKRMPKAAANKEQNKEKKKSEKKMPQATVVSDESDEELESEEEDSSSEGTSNHNNITPAPAVPSLTITRPSTEQSEESEPSSLPVNIPKLNQMSGIMGSSLDEDDDYDS